MFNKSVKIEPEEEEPEVQRRTLAFPQLPAELSKLVDGDSSLKVPDYTSTSIEELDDDFDPSKPSKQPSKSSTFIKGYYDNQGGYDSELDWNANRSRLLYDNYFTQNALWRRSLIALAKGGTLGFGVGVLASIAGKKYLTLTYKLPISFHIYTMGGFAFGFGLMNMVRQARRYQEYLAFQRSGITNPELIGLKDAKHVMADYMESVYTSEYVDEWKNSTEVDKILQQQMAGVRH